MEIKLNRIKGFLSRIRPSMAQLVGLIALEVLIFSVFLFIWMWLRAYHTGAVPVTTWDNYDRNHGPWRHLYELRDLWWKIPEVRFWSFILGSISLIIKPSHLALLTVIVSPVAGFIFMVSHYWLVD